MILLILMRSARGTFQVPVLSKDWQWLGELPDIMLLQRGQADNNAKTRGQVFRVLKRNRTQTEQELSPKVTPEIEVSKSRADRVLGPDISELA